MTDARFFVHRSDEQQGKQATVVSKDGKVKFYLRDCSSVSMGRAVNWCMSSTPEKVSEDSIFIRQSTLSTAAKFKSCQGKHFTTMHQAPGSDSVITWRSRTFRWVACPTLAKATVGQLVLVEDSTGQEVACVDGPIPFNIKTCQGCTVFISSDQKQGQDLLWMRIVIASGLLAAKQWCAPARRHQGQCRDGAASIGEVMFV